MAFDPRCDPDRVLGAIFGCALGDALGLPAEGGDKATLADRYPGGLSLPHAREVRGFPLNDWTDDTDQTVLIMRALSAPDPAKDFAARLVGWFNHGFPELGDTAGAGCGNMTWRVLRRPEFAEDPFGAAKAIIGPKAGNGALMRTAPCAFTEDPAGWAGYMCATTHSDARCAASCVVQCLLIRELASVAPGDKIDPGIVRAAIGRASKGLATRHRAELIAWASRSARLDALDIGGRDARGYTYKSLGCTFWALRCLLRAPRRDAALFKARMTELVMEAGDADTNAAIAGAVLGAALGYKNLPEDWLGALPHRGWLEAEARAWMAANPQNRGAS